MVTTKEYRETHRSQIKAYRRAYYLKHLDEEKSYQAEYRLAHGHKPRNKLIKFKIIDKKYLISIGTKIDWIRGLDGIWIQYIKGDA